MTSEFLSLFWAPLNFIYYALFTKIRNSSTPSPLNSDIINGCPLTLCLKKTVNKSIFFSEERQNCKLSIPCTLWLCVTLKTAKADSTSFFLSNFLQIWLSLSRFALSSSDGIQCRLSLFSYRIGPYLSTLLLTLYTQYGFIGTILNILLSLFVCPLIFWKLGILSLDSYDWDTIH